MKEILRRTLIAGQFKPYKGDLDKCLHIDTSSGNILSIYNIYDYLAKDGNAINELVDGLLDNIFSIVGVLVYVSVEENYLILEGFYIELPEGMIGNIIKARVMKGVQ